MRKHIPVHSPISCTIQDYSNPFSTVPRKMRSRVHTRAAGMARTTSDSDFDLQRTKSQLLKRNRESTLQRSTSADNLDEIVAVEGGRLRDRRTSTEVLALIMDVPLIKVHMQIIKDARRTSHIKNITRNVHQCRAGKP